MSAEDMSNNDETAQNEVTCQRCNFAITIIIITQIYLQNLLETSAYYWCLHVTSIKLPACELIPRISNFCLKMARYLK